jgi:hypothetical protein
MPHAAAAPPARGKHIGEFPCYRRDYGENNDLAERD